MKRLTVASIIVILLAATSSAQSKSTGGACKGLSEEAAALVSQYVELRERRHSQPQGTYDKDLDSSGGKLNEVLSRLGVEFGRKPYTRELIVACLGEPDAVRVGRHMENFLGIYNTELRKAGRKVEAGRKREYLIYFWRGWHDFLFFINEGGHIVDHGWWFAYE